jgi:glyoxylase-like metal-dependent hydrolase (beta-lactamase superfamily II)
MSPISDNLADSIVTVDLEHQGRERYIACCLLDCKGEFALLDPGPSSTLNVLRQKLRDRGIAISDIGSILLTHIHFDHAGATGALVEQNPRIRVFVHSKGAAHLRNPKRLLESASRVFGPRIEELWGSFEPVPAGNLYVLRGGENLTIGAREFEVLYTPGHAIHHVSYFEPASKVAFVGDAAGVRIDDSFVYPATPPPDIDLRAINESLDLILARKPQFLFLTHFGLMGRVEWHVAELRDRLRRWSEFVRLSLDRQGDDLRRAREFSEMVKAELSADLTNAGSTRFEKFISFQQNWYGLARYWRRQSASSTSSN